MIEPARYSIVVDRERALVRFTLSGFFRPVDYDGFSMLRAERQRELCARPHCALVDIRGLAILSADVLSAFQARLTNPAFPRAERLAFVVAPTLTRHQLVRALGGRDARCCRSLDAAEAWLASDEDAIAA